MHSRMDGKPPTKGATRNVVLAFFCQVKKNKIKFIYIYLYLYIYEKCALKINDLKKDGCQDEASIELLASLYTGHGERGAV